MPSNSGRTRRRAQPGAAVRAVDVEPQPALAAHLRDAREVVDHPGVRRAGGGRPRRTRRRRRPRRARRPAPRRSAAPLVVRHRHDVDVHHPRGRGHRGVRRVGERRSATAPGPPARRSLAPRAARRPAPTGSRPSRPTRTRRRPSPGSPARSAIQRSAWFSAQIAPPPSSQPGADRSRTRRPPGRTARSPSSARRARTRGRIGWSVEIVAGASTSAQTRSASSPPMPLGRDRRAGRRVSSSPGTVRSSGCGFAMRFSRVARRSPRASVLRVLVELVHRCIGTPPLLARTRGPARRAGPTRRRCPVRATPRAPGRTRRTRRRTSGCRPRCAAPRSSTAPRRRGS